MPLQLSAGKQTPRLCIFPADQQGPAGFHGHWSVSKTQLDRVLSLKYSIWTLTQQISSRTVREEGRQRKKRLLCANQLLKTLEQFSPGFPPCLQQILLPCMQCPPGRWPWERWDHTLTTVSCFIRVLGIQTQLFGFAQQGLCPLDHPLSPLKFFLFVLCLFNDSIQAWKVYFAGMVMLLSVGLTRRLHIVFSSLQPLAHTCSGNMHTGLEYRLPNYHPKKQYESRECMYPRKFPTSTWL